MLHYSFLSWFHFGEFKCVLEIFQNEIHQKKINPLLNRYPRRMSNQQVLFQIVQIFHKDSSLVLTLLLFLMFLIS